MTNQARYGQQVSDRRGAWLIEAVVVLGSLALIVSALCISAGASLSSARAKQTLIAMRSILQAGREYYDLKGFWPEDVEQVAGLLSSGNMTNAWCGKFVLSHIEAREWVETDVPRGIRLVSGPWPPVVVLSSGNRDLWRMSAPLVYGSAARLQYEK